MFKSLVVAIAFVLVTSTGSHAQDIARMEQVVQSHVTAGTFMGTVLVARDGAVVFDKAYGMANLELDVPNTTGHQVPARFHHQTVHWWQQSSCSRSEAS